MSKDTYYVKIRGRVLGPFLPDRLLEMAKSGKLSRSNMISTNNDHWQKAGEFPELFGSANTHDNAPATENATQNSEPVIPDVQEERIWHYGINGNTNGPESQARINELIQTGLLNKTDLIWRDGMSEWKPVSAIPAFSAYFRGDPSSLHQQSHIVNTNAVAETSAAETSAAEGVDLSLIRNEQTKQLPWTTFIFVNLCLSALGNFFGFIGGLVWGGKLANPVLITLGIFYLVTTVLTCLAAYYFQQHNTSTRRFTISRDIVDLNNSSIWLCKFWQLVGYILIMFWVSTLIFTIWFFTMSQAIIPSF
ncbi:DUF4339 domain-containing protein [Mariniblastus sp.]|nr:DUF4339 domain-containing protein [Mariniblastus sp.]